MMLFFFFVGDLLHQAFKMAFLSLFGESKETEPKEVVRAATVLDFRPFRGARAADFTNTKQQKSGVSERVGVGRKGAKGIKIQALDMLNDSKIHFL